MATSGILNVDIVINLNGRLVIVKPMSPRPRKASDDDILAAALRAMSRLGPTDLTLADIASEAGVTAGALVQRFGSRRALLLALSRRFATGTGDLFDQLRRAHPSPLAAIRAYADAFSALAASPAAIARNLAWLLNDLTDPDFYRLTLAQAQATHAALSGLVKGAVAAGELTRDADPRILARAIEAIVGGSLVCWALHQDGEARRWLRRDLDALLSPYVAPALRTVKTRAPARRKR
jgi:AcrR family transcriptional regulator